MANVDIDCGGNTYYMHRLTVQQTPGLERSTLHFLNLPPVFLEGIYFEPDLHYKSKTELQAIAIAALDRENNP